MGLAVGEELARSGRWRRRPPVPRGTRPVGSTTGRGVRNSASPRLARTGSKSFPGTAGGAVIVFWNSARASSSRLVGSREACISSGETMAPRDWSCRVALRPSHPKGAVPATPNSAGVCRRPNSRSRTGPTTCVRPSTKPGRDVAGAAGQQLPEDAGPPGSAAARRRWSRRTGPCPPGRAAAAPPRCRPASGPWMIGREVGPERAVDALERSARHTWAGADRRPGVESTGFQQLRSTPGRPPARPTAPPPPRRPGRRRRAAPAAGAEGSSRPPVVKLRRRVRSTCRETARQVRYRLAIVL